MLSLKWLLQSKFTILECVAYWRRQVARLRVHESKTIYKLYFGKSAIIVQFWQRQATTSLALKFTNWWIRLKLTVCKFEPDHMTSVFRLGSKLSPSIKYNSKVYSCFKPARRSFERGRGFFGRVDSISVDPVCFLPWLHQALFGC